RLHARAYVVGVRAQHEHEALHSRHRRHCGEHVIEQRAPVELRELLWAAEAGALARGEHHGADHDISPSSRSASSSSEAIELPARKWSTWGSAACIPRVSGS